jgi:hypothetical protein
MRELGNIFYGWSKLHATISGRQGLLIKVFNAGGRAVPNDLNAAARSRVVREVPRLSSRT